MARSKITAFIGMGSNLGDRGANIKKTLNLVRLIKGVEIEKISSIYETDPVGGPPQGKFLNGVFRINTSLRPLALLGEMKEIEKHLGRKRKKKNSPRTMDLDILLFGDSIINMRKLKIPHPRMLKREFVLRGLRELGEAF